MIISLGLMATMSGGTLRIFFLRLVIFQELHPHVLLLMVIFT